MGGDQNRIEIILLALNCDVFLCNLDDIISGPREQYKRKIRQFMTLLKELFLSTVVDI